MSRIRILYTVLLFLSACAPMAEIDIRVMDPAEITLPLHVRRISFMNRSVLPSQLYHDSSKWSPEELYILDTLVNHWIFNGVRQVMNESPLFELDTLKIVQARRKDSSSASRALTADQMEQIKRVETADAAISLEYYYIRDSSDVDVNLDEFSYLAYLGFLTTTIWRIYDLVEDTVLDTHIARNYLDWISEGKILDEAINGLPLATDAIRKAVSLSGSMYAERFSPLWEDQYRFFYQIGGPSMRDAARYVGAGDWNSAVRLWMEVSAGGDPRRASMACFNMALYHEMEDELMDAIDWAIKSYALRQHKLTRQYINILKRRYIDRKKLNKQLPAF